MIHSQDLFRSSDFERSSESAHIDDISEEIASTGSSRGRQLDSAEFSASDKEPCLLGSVSINSHAMSHQVASKPETSTKKRRLRMMDEDSDGVRIKVIPCVKEQFRQRFAATEVLEDDFYMPNRAQLMLNFLQKHGDRVVKETSSPKKRFPSTLKLAQHVLQKPSAGARK